MFNQYFSDQPLTFRSSNFFRKDGLGFEEGVTKLLSMVSSTSGNISICIKGDWGKGKTSYLRTAQRICLEKPKLNCFPVFFFNAWQYEKEDNPLSALSMTIVNQLLDNPKFIDILKSSDQGLRTKVKRFISNLANYSLSSLKGKITTQVFEIEYQHNPNFKPKKDEDQVTEIMNTFSNEARNLSEYYKIFDTLESLDDFLFKKEQFKIVLLIDDLDRCHANRVKHLLDIAKPMIT